MLRDATLWLGLESTFSASWVQDKTSMWGWAPCPSSSLPTRSVTFRPFALGFVFWGGGKCSFLQTTSEVQFFPCLQSLMLLHCGATSVVLLGESIIFPQFKSTYFVLFLYATVNFGLVDPE